MIRRKKKNRFFEGDYGGDEREGRNHVSHGQAQRSGG